MPVKKLKDFLDENNVKYISIKHSSAFTAQEVASSAHVSGKEFAKTVMIKVEKQIAMAVLPASYQIDFEQLKEIFHTKNVSLTSEPEFQDLFPGCETGAMPPFGNLYNIETYVAEVLEKNETIAFNAGSHTELIKLKYEDFKQLVKPKVFKFSWKTVSLPKDPQERWKEDL